MRRPDRVTGEARCRCPSLPVTKKRCGVLSPLGPEPVSKGICRTPPRPPGAVQCVVTPRGCGGCDILNNCSREGHRESKGATGIFRRHPRRCTLGGGTLRSLAILQTGAGRELGGTSSARNTRAPARLRRLPRLALRWRPAGRTKAAQWSEDRLSYFSALPSPRTKRRRVL